MSKPIWRLNDYMTMVWREEAPSIYTESWGSRRSFSERNPERNREASFF